MSTRKIKNLIRDARNHLNEVTFQIEELETKIADGEPYSSEDNYISWPSEEIDEFKNEAKREAKEQIKIAIGFLTQALESENVL